MRRIPAALLALSLLAAAAAPVGAAQPTRELITFGDFTEICFDTADAQWVELAGTIKFGKVAVNTFYDQAGNVVKQIYSGPLLVTVTDPTTGIAVQINTSATGILDYANGKLFFAGPQLFLNTVTLMGHFDFTTGTFHGGAKDFCPQFGYLSYDPNGGP